MLEHKHENDHSEPDISLLREWLPKIKSENRSYIKGAVNALLYVQEEQKLSVGESSQI